MQAEQILSDFSMILMLLLGLVGNPGIIIIIVTMTAW